MKSLIYLSATLFTLLTVVEPIWADEVWDQTEGVESESTLHLNPRLNALVGFGNLSLAGRATPERVGGGLTIELGQDWRRLETGVLMIPTGGEARSNSLALPMWAKFRVVHTDVLSVFVKAGAMSAFETRSARDQSTRNLDVLASGGLGGRIKLNGWADLVIDATYNRGLLDHARTAKGTDHQAGTLIFTGLSFPI